MNKNDKLLVDRRELLGAAGLGLLPGIAGFLPTPGFADGFDESPDLNDPPCTNVIGPSDTRCAIRRPAAATTTSPRTVTPIHLR